MAIVSSTITAGEVQADGRRFITETHVAEDGTDYTYTYLTDNSIDTEAVSSARVVLLNTQIAAKAAAQLLVTGTTLPMSTYEFLSRMTPQERIGIRSSALIDPVVGDFMYLLNQAAVVYPNNPDVRAGLSYLVMQGKLTADRATTIGAV
jgi:hypothetical protein